MPDCNALSAGRLKSRAAAVVRVHLQADFQIRQRQYTCCFVRPFGQFEPGTGEHIPKPRVFPFARVVKAVKVKVPDIQAWQLIGLDHRIRGAFNAPLYAQRTQQMAYQGSLTGA